MKKTLFALAVLFSAVFTASAVPAKRGVWQTITLADGTKVKVELVGDEHFHWLQAADGTRYRYDSDSDTYCIFQESEQKAALASAKARRARTQVRTASRRKSADKSIFQGTKHALVILAQFQDSKFKTGHDVDLFKQIVNGENYTENGFKGSVRDYFRAQSGGAFDLEFDVVGICQLANNYAYYGKDGKSEGDDTNPGAMIAEACTWAHEQGVDFSKYDWDNDGYVEEVFVLYAGKGQADGGDANTIWPHKWELTSSSYGKMLTYNNKRIDVYACSSELNGDGTICGIGTFCHEFSHCMGFPDLYDTYDGDNFGMADFDLMDYGSYNEDGFVPCGYSAYEKNECGWITLHDVTDIEEDLNVSDLKAVSDGGDAYILKNKGHEDEYYIVENRQLTNWDVSLPASGIMITHVDYDDYIWTYNVPNATNGEYYDANDKYRTNGHQRLTIFHADNKDGFYDTYGDLYPYKGNNSLTATTTPAAALYNTNSDGTKYMHLDIKDMAVASDGTASLTFSKAVRDSGGDTPVTPDGSTLFYESFDKCAETGGNDGVWSAISTNVLFEDDDADNAGWTSTNNKVFCASKCVRLGSSKSGGTGTITTPSFTVNGMATMTFMAGAWNTTDDASKLTLTVSNGSLGKSYVPLTKGAWGTYSVTINATGAVKVTLAADKKRFFLDEVKVVDPSIDGISEVEALQTATPVAYYSLDGTRLDGPRPGICIVRYANGEARKVSFPE